MSAVEVHLPELTDSSPIVLTAPDGVEVTLFRGIDGATVVQIDTDEAPTPRLLRVNVNGRSVFNGDPDAL